jgi:hypothetical protein
MIEYFKELLHTLKMIEKHLNLIAQTVGVHHGPESTHPAIKIMDAKDLR